MEGSYYVASANPFSRAPKLEGDANADVVVIGGGYTGLHAALNAAERGFSVILLESGRIGWGASGRNGGQMIPGWRKGAPDLIRSYGAPAAKRLFEFAVEARALTLQRIQRHDIRCDLLLNGHLTAAAKPRDLDGMRAEADSLSEFMGYESMRLLDRNEMRARVNSTIFHGGLLDEGGGHLHPLNYALGLADAARSMGVQIFEDSRVDSIEVKPNVVANTEGGRVRARHGVLACDALLGGLEPRIAGRIMPVANYLIATRPLDNPNSVVADGLAVSDSKFVVSYFRVTSDGRLVFGGGERYTTAPPSDIEAFVRPHLSRVFPQLANVEIDYAWGGLVSITMTRLPHVGRLGELYFAHGYSGQGVLIPALVGKVLTEAMAGSAERVDVLASIAPPEFPGGVALRSPLHVLGMLWYALRDRL